MSDKIRERYRVLCVTCSGYGETHTGRAAGAVQPLRGSWLGLRPAWMVARHSEAQGLACSQGRALMPRKKRPRGKTAEEEPRRT